MNHHTRNAPSPIVREPRLINADRSEVISISPQGDRFNLTTGAFDVARIVGGRRWDTRNALLVAGRGSGVDSIEIDRLYRVSRDAFFHLHFTWCRGWEFIEGPSITPVDYLTVFDCAKHLVQPSDAFAFLRNWQVTEWLPYDFGEAAAWAEQVLTADEYERLFLLGAQALEATEDENDD